MLDGVLRWLVRVTGLEPKLLTLTAILIVYAASIYLYAKEKEGGGAGVAPAQPSSTGELASALARVERGVETVAKYLINLETQPREPRFELKHEYEAFLPKNGVGAPPRNHHRPTVEAGVDLETFHPQKRVGHILSQPEEAELGEGFSLPLPVISRETLQQPESHEPEQILPEPEPQVQPSPAVMETLRRTMRKAGRTP